MKKIVIISFVLFLELKTSDKYNAPHTRPPYNNREILDSLNRQQSKSVDTATALTFAQREVRKFMNQKDSYNSTKKRN